MSDSKRSPRARANGTRPAPKRPQPVGQPDPENASPEHEPGPHPDAAEDHDVAPDAEDVPDGIAWTITERDPGNPFTSRLTFTDNGDEVFWVDLDPLTGRALSEGLAAVQTAQRSALLGPTPPTGHPPARHEQADAAPRNEAAPGAAPATTWGWIRTHKFLTFLIVFMVVFGGYGLLGSLHV